MDKLMRRNVGLMPQVCIALFLTVCLSCFAMAEQEKYVLTAISGADGRFETVEMDEQTVLRAVEKGVDNYARYMYFRAPDNMPAIGEPLYLEVTYKDVGTGLLYVQYNARNPKEDYREAVTGFGRLLLNQGSYRTAVFELVDAEFRHGQNLGADLRLSSPPSVRLHIAGAAIFLEPTPQFLRHSTRPWLLPYRGPTRSDIDATTLNGKVLCGYQGWFRCPGDGAEKGWVHWSRGADLIAPETLTFEMWPEMSEYTDEEKYSAPGFTYPNGNPASLFSSANRRTIERHFNWMQHYGIDGAEIQRFVGGLQDPTSASRVLGYVRAAANRTGRVFNIGYDMTGTSPEAILGLITNDWKWLVDGMKITTDPRYLHHNGRPVVTVYGFFSDRFAPEIANSVIDFFKNDGVTLIGGCQWWWRREGDEEWAKVFRRFDVIRPWNVGNVSSDGNRKYASTGYWADDLAEATNAGMLYMPVIYPGFGWDNLQRTPPGTSTMPRLGGEFFWKQFHTAAELRIHTAFVAMFDEVDEGTAIFKVTNAPPVQAHFLTYDDKPSDWYLRLTGEGTKLIRGAIENTPVIPIKPFDMQLLPSVPEIQDVTKPQQLKVGEKSATIKVRLTGVDILRVSGTVISPIYDPDGIFEDWSDVDFETIEFQRKEEGLYEGKYDNFSQVGTYTIVVNAVNPDGSAVPVETTVTVFEPTSPWDANADGQVDISDLVLVAFHFGETIKEPISPNPDINRDGVVDIRDLILVALHLDGVNPLNGL